MEFEEFIPEDDIALYYRVVMQLREEYGPFHIIVGLRHMYERVFQRQYVDPFF